MAEMYRTGVRQLMFAALDRVRRPRPVNLSIDVPESGRPCRRWTWTADRQRAFLRRIARRRLKKGYKVTRKGRFL